jgi:hypothetical protein
MEVEDDMDRHSASASDRDPTWEEAVAQFRTAKPVELVRPARKVVIQYRYEHGSFSAISPDLTGFEVTGASLPAVKALVREKLESYLDRGVELDEREPSGSDLVAQVRRDRKQRRPGWTRTSTGGSVRGVLIRIGPSSSKARDVLAKGLRRVAEAIESSKSSKGSVR